MNAARISLMRRTLPFPRPDFTNLGDSELIHNDLHDQSTQTDSGDNFICWFPCRAFLPFEGIIAFLTKNCQGNVHKKDFVRVTLCSPHCGDPKSHPPFHVVDFTTTSKYCHTETGFANQWVCYDFKMMRVTPTHYSFQSREPNYAHNLTAWVIEGSETGEPNSWFEMDKQNNRTDLDGPGYHWTYRIANPRKCRCVRVCHRRNSSNTNYLILAKWELFGELQQAI
jgi:hypothetical protein